MSHWLKAMAAIAFAGETLILPLVAVTVLTFRSGLAPDDEGASLTEVSIWAIAFFVQALCSGIVGLFLMQHSRRAGGLRRSVEAGASVVTVATHSIVAGYFLYGIVFQKFDSWGSLELFWIGIPGWLAITAAWLLKRTYTGDAVVLSS
jgi:hypothetical protein